MQSGNISLYSCVLSCLLATSLQAGVVYDITPSGGDVAKPWSLEIQKRSPLTESLPGDPTTPDRLFGSKRWPCIVKGAAWSRRQEKAAPPPQAQQLIPRLKEAFAAEGLPRELAWVAEVESTFYTNAVSKSGALGLFQFKAAAAKRFDLLHEGGDFRAEPEKSARAAARYLAHLHERLGDWTLAVAGYNAGEGCVERLLKKHKARNYEEIALYLPPQTQVYVIKVMSTLELRENTFISALPDPR